jgi:hypothetical protein
MHFQLGKILYIKVHEKINSVNINTWKFKGLSLKQSKCKAEWKLQLPKLKSDVLIF